MLVSKTLGKIEKLLGGDALEHRWYEAPVYRFTLQKEVSQLTEEGHGWEWSDNGEAIVYELTDDGWANATVYPLDDSNMAMKAVFMSSDVSENVCSVKGVEDVQKEVIGRTEWDITVDVASGLITDVERKEIRDGNDKSERMHKHLQNRR